LKKTIPLLLALSILCLPALALWAQEEEVVHTVKKGDTLWDISNKYLKTPWSWPLIWANNETITNPHLIYPGDKVIISYKDGAYQITVVPADGGPSRTYSLKEIADQTGKTMVLSPNYACYIYKDTPFPGKGAVVGKQESGDFSSVDDVILIKMSEPTSAKGVAILTPLTVVKKKDTPVGYVYKVVGLAAITDTPSGFVRARVTYANQEIKKGDIVTDDITNLKPLTLRLSQPVLSVDGIVLDFLGGVSGSSASDIVFTDIGASQGLKPGSLVTIYKPQVIKDVGTIEDYCALGMVLQTLDSSAMIVALESKDIIKKGYPVKSK